MTFLKKNWCLMIIAVLLFLLVYTIYTSSIPLPDVVNHVDDHITVGFSQIETDNPWRTTQINSFREAFGPSNIDFIYHEPEEYTAKWQQEDITELIREKALHCLQEEIPHGIAVAIDSMKVRNKVMHIDATIICERDSHKGIIIGKKGSMLKKIGSTARYEIEKMLDQQVNLKLWVKVKKDWRDSEFLMKNFGYREDE